MAVKLFQVNLNHACQAQYLFVQSLTERGFGLAIVAETYRIPEDNPNWIGDNCGSAAIVRADVDLPPLKCIEREVGFVAVQWGSMRVISCYAPPPQLVHGGLRLALRAGRGDHRRYPLYHSRLPAHHSQGF